MRHRVCLGLGSNLLDKQSNLSRALHGISSFARITALSSLYRTQPVGYLDQDWFLNAVAVADTALEPLAFLESLQNVELSMGRVRLIQNGPRLIDLDVLLWDDAVLQLGSLEIPHPRMLDRHFVMIPLIEVAPNWVHPVAGKPIAALCRKLGPTHGVEPFSSPDWPPLDLPC